MGKLGGGKHHSIVLLRSLERCLLLRLLLATDKENIMADNGV